MKWPGQSDPHRVQTGPAGHLAVDDGEDDGQAPVALQHLVEEAVPRVGAHLPGRAAEALFLEEHAVHGPQRRLRPGRRRSALRPGSFQVALHPPGQVVQAGQIGGDVQVRAVLGRDQQRALGQIDRFVRQGRDFRERRRGSGDAGAATRARRRRRLLDGPVPSPPFAIAPSLRPRTALCPSVARGSAWPWPRAFPAPGQGAGARCYNPGGSPRWEWTR